MGNAAHATALHYEQRRQETTSLYRLIATHLETFLAEARAAHDRGVPRYVERELRAYLACGIHAHGFLRARCSTISVPGELAAAVRKRVGSRGLSGFVARALAHELEREGVKGLLAELEQELGSPSKADMARARRSWPKR